MSTHTEIVKTCIICNPHAGPANGSDSIVKKLESLAGAVVRLTSASGEAAALARAAVAEGFDTIVAAGGDGTLNEVINGIALEAAQVRVGLIPLGTGNDFARMIALPSSLEECLNVIQAGRTRAIDLVRVTSE